MSDNLHDRLDQLESLVDQQQQTIEQQQERIEELTAERTAADHPHLVADGGDVKVVGEIDVDEGIGVRGKTTGDGITHAVEGEATSVNGRGVAGFVTSEDYEHDPLMATANGVVGVTDRSGEDDGIDEAVGVGGQAIAESGLAFGVAGQCQSDDGYGVLGSNSGSGYGVASIGDSFTWGDHLVNGDQEIDGDLSFPDGTPQLTAGPVAKGYINSDGTIGNAVNVDETEWDGSRYVIALNDIDYDATEYVTLVMPMSGPFPDAMPTDTVEGELVVAFEDKEQYDFTFVTYNLPDGTETTTAGAEAQQSEKPLGDSELLGG